MAKFECAVVRVESVEPILDADAIEVAVVGAYRSVVRKGQFAPGDLAVYLPEASILPDPLLEKLNLTGKLAGSQKNRIKAVRLRGVVSQGICMVPPRPVVEGEDLADELGVTKHMPSVPVHLAGQVQVLPAQYQLCFDLENIKKYPRLFVEGEDVVMTEKLHGTQLGCVVDHDVFFVTSKGLMGKGLCLKDNEANQDNFYLRTVREYDIPGRVRKFLNCNYPVHIFGEGLGVQDLKYGTNSESSPGRFRVFAVAYGGQYLDDAGLDAFCAATGLERVPVVYRGPFTWAALEEATSGKETLTGKGLHIREGVVVAPVKNRFVHPIGLLRLKSVSPEYLLRKGDVSEFE